MLHDPVQDRVGVQLGADPQVPLVGLELRREERGATTLASLKYLEQVHGVERE